MARATLGAFEGPWVGLTICLLAIPLAVVVQTLIAGFVARNVRRRLVRVAAYAVILVWTGWSMNCAYAGFHALLIEGVAGLGRWAALFDFALAVVCGGAAYLMLRAIKDCRPFLYHVWLCGGAFCLVLMLNLAGRLHATHHEARIFVALALAALGAVAIACFVMLRRSWSAAPPELSG